MVAVSGGIYRRGRVVSAAVASSVSTSVVVVMQSIGEERVHDGKRIEEEEQ